MVIELRSSRAAESGRCGCWWWKRPPTSLHPSFIAHEPGSGVIDNPLTTAGSMTESEVVIEEGGGWKDADAKKVLNSELLYAIVSEVVDE